MAKADVTVGRMVEVTREEARQLEELAGAMASHTRHRRVGWFFAFLRAHKEAHRVINRIFERAHTN